jgi:hypothetical protein
MSEMTANIIEAHGELSGSVILFWDPEDGIHSRVKAKRGPFMPETLS